jgi:hypothetical protein
LCPTDSEIKDVPLPQSERTRTPGNTDKINKNLTDSLITLINWKDSPEEFNRQLDILESSQYLKTVENIIVFIREDAYKDVIALFEYWFETKKIIPKKREGKILIPQTAIVQAFKRFSQGKPENFNTGQLSMEKDRMTEEEIADRAKNFSKILKINTLP